MSNTSYQRSPEKIPGNQITISTSETTPSLAIIEALAELEDVDPTELDITLYDYLNPEALDSVMESDAVEVTFSIDEYEIRADSGVIHVIN